MIKNRRIGSPAKVILLQRFSNSSDSYLNGIFFMLTFVCFIVIVYPKRGRFIVVSYVKNFSINQRNVEFDVRELPEVSGTTREIFGRLGYNMPFSNEGFEKLKNKIEKLDQAVQDLQEAKNHSTRNKVRSILIPFIIGALVAAGIALTIFFPPVGIPLVVIAGLAFVVMDIAMAVEGATEIGSRRDKVNLDPIFSVPPIGIIIGLIDAFTRVSRRSKRVDRLIQDVEEQRQNMEHYLNKAFTFVQSHGQKGLRQIEHRLENARQQLADLNHNLLISNFSILQMEGEIKKMETARDQLSQTLQLLSPRIVPSSAVSANF